MLTCSLTAHSSTYHLSAAVARGCQVHSVASHLGLVNSRVTTFGRIGSLEMKTGCIRCGNLCKNILT